MQENIQRPAWQEPLWLISSLMTGTLLCLLLCIIAIRTAIGISQLEGEFFGVSPGNQQLTWIAAMISAFLTCLVTGIVFLTTSARRRWLLFLPVFLLPILGGAGFFFFLISGLG